LMLMASARLPAVRLRMYTVKLPFVTPSGQIS
jgi:hypothetical protein